jgi:succinoglycan biosynthesis protein ExoM
VPLGNGSSDDSHLIPLRGNRRRLAVHICVATFHRATGLRRVLAGLARLQFRDGTTPEVEIVVVDNDAQGSAWAICEEARSQLPWPLRYIVEPTRGIAQARNAAVRAVVDLADFVAFIDDDEVPDPLWLDELLRVQQAYDADVVTGPVFPYFEGDAPVYVTRGRYFYGFDPPQRTTGMLLDRAITGNVVACSRVFRNMPTLFDERLGLKGGEDVLFFQRVARAGFKIVWAADARISEWVPSSRASVAWILKRAFRTGNSMAICDLDMIDSKRRRAWCFLRMLGSIVKAILVTPKSIIIGRHQALESLRIVVCGLGYFAGAAGIHYEEYRTVRGG